MSATEKVRELTENLNKLLAQKAGIDEQITGIRNAINGVNLGVELQKEIVAEAEAKATAETEED